MFSDPAGRLWRAAPARDAAVGAVVFSSLSDPRQAVRALAVDAGFDVRQVSDETLRIWLRDAPRIGSLS
ncbi:MAG: hypothetical protein NVS9B3_10290 [Gemmatimonadaceae bacterium]